MEGITRAQPPPCVPKHASLDIADMTGVDFPLYVYKSRRGAKRGDESRETYKLPHRLIEKKRRDRINECIAQLKDLLPEHLKLTTLGHLEKAVVLELTLKHVNALNTLLEQQQRKIVELQKDLQISDHGGDDPEVSEQMFRSGFHLCAKEVLHYLARRDGSQDLMPSHVIGHIRKVASEVLQHQSSEKPKKAAAQPSRAAEGPSKNCVPVIQRTCPGGLGEQSGSDTDTDSGYGGEPDKRDPKSRWSDSHRKEVELKRTAADGVKQEGGEPRTKKSRTGSSEDESLPGPPAGGPGSYVAFSPNQQPLCLPFYLFPPAAAAAAYLPVLEKCWYPGGMPVIYPGASASAASLPPETLSPPLVMSQRAGSPLVRQSTMDSPRLHKASQRGSPGNLETKE
ncbi:class E basic helix-loop-helix protein 40 isoform X2 [Hippocampus comes]|uniref:class E basic helix-loop-helix protein 40 isoform X2 n=1 Tax=Hippocampus comes TaxID=109280 RepID=UPI00094E5978|nr:PREDICTED: class E basic helix-loop-helix protein 40 isoform X2 [Hippocampus comes]